MSLVPCVPREAAEKKREMEVRLKNIRDNDKRLRTQVRCGKKDLVIMTKKIEDNRSTRYKEVSTKLIDPYNTLPKIETVATPPEDGRIRIARQKYDEAMKRLNRTDEEGYSTIRKKIRRKPLTPKEKEEKRMRKISPRKQAETIIGIIEGKIDPRESSDSEEDSEEEPDDSPRFEPRMNLAKNLESKATDTNLDTSPEPEDEPVTLEEETPISLDVMNVNLALKPVPKPRSEDKIEKKEGGKTEEEIGDIVEDIVERMEEEKDKEEDDPEKEEEEKEKEQKENDSVFL